MKQQILIFFMIITTTIISLHGQNEQINDSLIQRITNNEYEVNMLKKTKISGYIQFQYQRADSSGIETYIGDKFDNGQNQRFNIRKGRLKTLNNGKYSTYSVTFDFNEKGVGLKEAYTLLKEPYVKTFALQAGLFYRPFGFEIGYSSSLLEYIERSRIIQNIFPGETDLGFAIIAHIPNAGFLSNFTFQSGFFNGTYNKTDIDNYKDFIGNIKYSVKTSLADLGLGASYYTGKMANFSRYYYEFSSDTGYRQISTDTLHGIKREYYGFDFQLKTIWVLGKTVVRFEYIWGQQPATSKSTKTPIETILKNIPIGSTYLRKFNGGYIVLIQQFFTTKHNFVFRYDWYDPNTQISKINIKSTTPSNLPSGMSKADVFYKTIEFGWFYELNENWRFSAYYDIPINEKTQLPEYLSDQRDNIFSFRLQYKF